MKTNEIRMLLRGIKEELLDTLSECGINDEDKEISKLLLHLSMETCQVVTEEEYHDFDLDDWHQYSKFIDDRKEELTETCRELKETIYRFTSDERVNSILNLLSETIAKI